MTLCVEPSAWFDGVGHLVAEEKMVGATTENGAELLSPGFPEQLEVLGGMTVIPQSQEDLLRDLVAAPSTNPP